MKAYAAPVLRIGIALVILWFGITQIITPLTFFAYLPVWARSLPVEASTLLLLNGIFETVFGLLLLAGIFSRISAALLAVHLLGISIMLGYNDIAIRDIGLTIALIAIALHGNDQYSLQNKLPFLKRQGS